MPASGPSLSGGAKTLRGSGSLRLRLFLGASLWVAAALTAAGFGLQRLFADYVEFQATQRMESALDRLAGTLEVAADGRVTLFVPLPDPMFHRPLSGVYWQISGPDGAILRSRSLWDSTIPPPPRSRWSRVLGDDEDAEDGRVQSYYAAGPANQTVLVIGRQVTYPDTTQPVLLTVAQDATMLRQLVGDFTRTVVISLGLLAAGLLVGVWAQVAFGLTPLRRLRRALALIRAGKANRLGDRYPDEVQPLVDDLNALLVHNARMVENAQVQAGNLAHALKTPLAIVANEAETLAVTGAGESAALLDQQVDVMRRHIDVHLARARAQAAGEAHGLRTDAGPSLERLARVLGRLHDLEIAVETSRPPDFKGDRQTLEEILGNLMENACKWAKSEVRVRAAALDAPGPVRLILSVEDDGPGIPEENIDAALRRGMRLDESKPGSGLGLSIVDDLTRAAGGRVSLDRSPDLGGLRATVDLPAVAPEPLAAEVKGKA